MAEDDEPVATLTVPADLGRLAEVRRFVREAADREGGSELVRDDLVQAVDECVTNVIVHGYAGERGTVVVSVVRRDDRLAVTVRDTAPSFDPTGVPTPALDEPLETRRRGGMGVHLMRELTDQVEHQPLSPRGNELTMVKRLERRAGGSDGGDAR
jgi:anti-sigma regulatory factor (Ser/Thr protein kinase)